MTAPVLWKRDVFYMHPDCRTLSAGAFRQVPYSLYQRSSLNAGVGNTIKDIGKGIPVDWNVD